MSLFNPCVIKAVSSGVLSIKAFLFRSLAVAIASLLLSPLVASAGSYSLPVGSGAYEALEILEAEGLIRSGLLANRPVARHEATRLLLEAIDSTAKASEGASWAIRRLRLELGEDYGADTYLKPIERITFKYSLAAEQPHYLNLNSKGDSFREGSNIRAGFSAHARLLDKVSLYINPELRYFAGGRGNTDVEIVEGYASLTLWNIELTAGRQALWWGPAKHGTLLLTDNAQPFDLIKITNPAPVLLPWVFSIMGPVRLTAFATRLEEDRHVSRPYLAGMRLDMKPSPHLQIGLSRAAMFGGGGRKVNAATVWEVFTARNENNADKEPGNQLASVDLKLIVPWRIQPFVLYAEAGAEDMYLPALGAYTVGAFMPRLPGLDAFSLRVEYADNIIAGRPRLWYTHDIYGTGYTYRGRVIGHHMGTASRDFFSEVRYSSSRIGEFTASYNVENGKPPHIVKSRNEYYAISWERLFADMYDVRIDYAYDKRVNIGSIAGADASGHNLFMEVGVLF